jgi:molybdate/tungstate transport system ATP-binding protein
VPDLELRVESLSKVWHGFKLKGINLTVASGEYFILLGPTGAGKTLLLETIMGFYTPDSGKILLDGVDITGLPPEKRGMGYVPQTCVLFPHMNVRQNVEFGLRMQHIPESKRMQIVDYVLETTGLTSLALRSPQTLSGGEKQKISLARVLATKPNMMLLDEPLTGMDAETARELRAKLMQIHREGISVIHVTHNQMEGFSLGDKMGIIRAGEIIQTGKTRDVISNPQSEYAAKFLGYENVFEAHLVQCKTPLSQVRVETLNLDVTEKVNNANCIIAFRPEDVSVDVPQKSDVGANIFEGTLVGFIDQGHFVSLTFNVGITLRALVTRSAFLKSHFEIGAKVKLAIEPDVIKVIECG